MNNNLWKKYNLEELCFFQEGPGLRNYQFTKTGIKFLNIRCIQDGIIKLEEAQYLSEKEVNAKYKHFLLNEGDYVLSSSGSIGLVAEVTTEDLPLLLNTSIIRFRSKNKKILNHKFLKHYLRSNFFFKKIYDKGQGSAQINFGPTHLKTLKINLPDLEIQKNLNDVLDTIDKYINSLSLKLNKFEILHKSLIYNILFKGLQKKEMKDSIFGKIPKEWEIIKIGDACEEVKNNKINTDTSNIPILSMTKHKGFVESLKYFKKQIFSKNVSNYKIVKKKQFAYATIHLDEGSIDYLKNYDNGLISPMYKVFEIKNKINHDYLLYLLKSDFFLKVYKSLGKGSINRRMSISFKDLKKIEIPCPKLDEQLNIVDALNSSKENISNLKTKISKYRIIYQSILDNFFIKKAY